MQVVIKAEVKSSRTGMGLVALFKALIFLLNREEHMRADIYFQEKENNMVPVFSSK
jgi:hypothetical protein